jgi:hypothetical protein
MPFQPDVRFGRKTRHLQPTPSVPTDSLCRSLVPQAGLLSVFTEMGFLYERRLPVAAEPQVAVCGGLMILPQRGPRGIDATN